ncbi:MAG: NADPH-dependent assimilatory sulfite reductase hemoprotein subunit [Balneolales bacterium]
MDDKIKLSKEEQLKSRSLDLRGDLIEELGNGTTNFTKDSYQLLKFHGLYQQDDRDKRKGKEKEYSFMIRCRIPGGGLNAEQYLVHDRLADTHANGTLRITTRQTFQFHGVLKHNISETLSTINDLLLTTMAACGDVVRNVMYSPIPAISSRQDIIKKHADEISNKLLPKTKAFHDVWLDGEKVYTGEKEYESVETFYGPKYLPRKFKIGIAEAGDNSIDVYTQDIGIVALFNESDDLEGFNLIAGGGLGMNHKKKDTFPRLGDHLGFIDAERLYEVVETIVSVQRDHGNRSNRRQARMKYLIDSWGIDKFKDEVEQRLGYPLEPFRPMPEFELKLYHGWHKQQDGRWFLGLFVENGRIKNEGNLRLKDGLHEAISKYQPDIQLTPHQDIILTNINEADRAGIEYILKENGIPLPDHYSKTVRFAMACPAMPTCGLAITESERVMPQIIREIENEIARIGLQDKTITVRMTGCPNGCARPYVADIGFVGQSLEKYSVFVGGDPSGAHINTLYRELVPFEELTNTVRPLLEQYKEEHKNGETFGAFWRRTELPQPNNVKENAQIE